MTRPDVLVTNYLVPEVIEAVQDRFAVTEAYGIPRKELLNIISDYPALLCRYYTKVDSEVLEAGASGKLEIVVSATSGIDHVDIARAQELGIVACGTPACVTNANAEFNIGALIALSRNFRQATKMVQEGRWDQQAVLGREIRQKRLGLVGFGRIGRLTAQYAGAFGMDVSACDPYVPEDVFAATGVNSVPLDTLMAGSDYVVFNVPLTPETQGMVGERELRLMRASSYIVQVARGGVIAEEALLRALRERAIAGAAIDVFVDEPNINPGFRELDNVILTPHVGCSTQESRYRAGTFAFEELARYFNGEPLQHQLSDSGNSSPQGF